MREGRGGGGEMEKRREEWRDRRPEGGLLAYPLYLWAERRKRKAAARKEGGKEGRNEKQPGKVERGRLRGNKRDEGEVKKDKRKRQTEREGRKRNLNVDRRIQDEEMGRQQKKEGTKWGLVLALIFLVD